MSADFPDPPPLLGLPRKFDGARISAVRGGHSGNEVFRAEFSSESMCIKRFANVSDADREWNLLIALAGAGVRCVPSPQDRHGEQGEILAMSWCPGEPLGNESLTEIQVEALAASLIEFGNAVGPQFPPATNQTARIVERAIEARTTIFDAGDSTVADLHSGIDALLAHTEVAQLANHGTIWLGRGDPNLANALWSDRVMFVDLEHSGRNDRDAELADLAEHLQSHECGEEVWTRLWDNLDLDSHERRRICFMRALTAIWWLAMLMTNDLAKQLNPPERVQQQASRIRGLLRGIN